MIETGDAAIAEAFGERMLGALNDAALILLTSLGQRTALFDTMAELPPSTSAQIADRAGLQERYVREWLGGMVVSGVVEYDPGEGTYHLPVEHAAALTRAAGPNNMGAFAAYVPVLASVEDEVAECFRIGGGVPYSSYPRLQYVTANTIDRYATYTSDGARVRATGPIGCTRGERVSIRVTVTQSAITARARKAWTGRCTGELQHWQVRARTRPGTRFETGRGRACAVAKTYAAERVTDTRKWCERVSLSARF